VLALLVGQIFEVTYFMDAIIGTTGFGPVTNPEPSAVWLMGTALLLSQMWRGRREWLTVQG
jgi:hypothetical protein